MVPCNPMVQRKNILDRKFVRYTLTGTLAITSIVVTGKLLNRLVAHTDAQSNQVKDETVTTEDVPDAKPAGAVVAPLQTQTTDQEPLITTYTVKTGDTISEIAAHFHVSENTIRWANDIPLKSTIRVGDELVILPFTGIQYKVKKGDTLSGITTTYGGDINEIMTINGLEDQKDIKPGDTILIPNGEIPNQAPAKPAAKPIQKTAPSKTESTTTNTAVTESQPESSEIKKHSTNSYFIRPLVHGVLTQGIHDDNAVDFGVPIGTSVRAAAAGRVIIARYGNNGGYGNYIVINHDNGSQTLYAHLSKIEVSANQTVDQGTEIGKSGNSGHSTGPHLHFGVHGSTNEFGDDSKGTQF